MELTVALMAGLVAAMAGSMVEVYRTEKRKTSKTIVLRNGEHRVEFKVDASPEEVERAMKLFRQQMDSDIKALHGETSGGPSSHRAQAES